MKSDFRPFKFKVHNLNFSVHVEITKGVFRLFKLNEIKKMGKDVNIEYENIKNGNIEFILTSKREHQI